MTAALRTFRRASSAAPSLWTCAKPQAALIIALPVADLRSNNSARRFRPRGRQDLRCSGLFHIGALLHRICGLQRGACPKLIADKINGRRPSPPVRPVLHLNKIVLSALDRRSAQPASAEISASAPATPAKITAPCAEPQRAKHPKRDQGDRNIDAVAGTAAPAPARRAARQGIRGSQNGQHRASLPSDSPRRQVRQSAGLSNRAISRPCSATDRITPWTPLAVPMRLSRMISSLRARSARPPETVGHTASRLMHRPPSAAVAGKDQT